MPIEIFPSGLTVEEVDGNPAVRGVRKILVTNGTLTEDGQGQVTISTGGGGGGSIKPYNKTIENPLVGDNLGLFYTTVAITVTTMTIAVKGSSTPSVTVDIHHHTSRNNAGNVLITTPTASTEAANNAESTGHVINSGFNDATIPANSFVWFECDAVSGNVDNVMITIEFTED